MNDMAGKIISDTKKAEQQYDLAYEFYFKGDWDSAERCIREAVNLVPTDPRYRLLSAQVFCALDKITEAWSELHALREYDPANAGAKSLELLLKTKMQKEKVRTQRPAGGGILGAFKSMFKAS